MKSEAVLRILILAVTVSFLATPAGSQNLSRPDCATARADMNRAIDDVTAAVSHVLAQSTTFRAILAKESEDRAQALEFFCRRQTFIRYDAADVAFDDGTYRARALYRACPDADQQARQTIARLAGMRADNYKMRLRQRGVCASALSQALQKLTINPPATIIAPPTSMGRLGRVPNAK
ncbi:MAG: hypothetical protein RL274_1731 [Pseudomonadota bacterium]|jgi:hypothetical protein